MNSEVNSGCRFRYGPISTARGFRVVSFVPLRAAVLLILGWGGGGGEGCVTSTSPQWLRLEAGLGVVHLSLPPAVSGVH